MSQRVKIVELESAIDELRNGSETLRAVHNFKSPVRHFPEEDERNRQPQEQRFDKTGLASGLPGELSLIIWDDVLVIANLLCEHFNRVLRDVEVDSLGLLDDLCFGKFDLLSSRTLTGTRHHRTSSFGRHLRDVDPSRLPGDRRCH